VVVVEVVKDRGQLVTLAAGTDEQTETADQFIDPHGGLLFVNVGTCFSVCVVLCVVCCVLCVLCVLCV
jgi:hypothetical protein